MRRETAGVGLLLVIFMFLLVLEPLPVHAAATLIQQNNDGCIFSCTTSVSVPFSSSVTSGDVIVVGVASVNFAPSLPSDSKGSSFTVAQSASIFSTTFSAIFVASLSSSGSDTVTVSWGTAPFVAGVYIYEVSGVTTAGMGGGSGSNGGTSSMSTSPVSFQSGAFLLGMMEPNGQLSTPGAGFTLSPLKGGTTSDTMAQYSTSGVSSPTTFPAALKVNTIWVEVGVALNPTAAVGGRVLSIDPVLVLMPWLILTATLTAAVVGALLMRRRMHQNKRFQEQP